MHFLYTVRKRLRPTGGILAAHRCRPSRFVKLPSKVVSRGTFRTRLGSARHHGGDETPEESEDSGVEMTCLEERRGEKNRCERESRCPRNRFSEATPIDRPQIHAAPSRQER